MPGERSVAALDGVEHAVGATARDALVPAERVARGALLPRGHRARRRAARRREPRAVGALPRPRAVRAGRTGMTLHAGVLAVAAHEALARAGRTLRGNRRRTRTADGRVRHGVRGDVAPAVTRGRHGRARARRYGQEQERSPTDLVRTRHVLGAHHRSTSNTSLVVAGMFCNSRPRLQGGIRHATHGREHRVRRPCGHERCPCGRGGRPPRREGRP